jgi:DnaJ family protein A protein 5
MPLCLTRLGRGATCCTVYGVLQAQYEDADWIRSSEAPDVDYGADEEDEEPEEVYECVVCDKVFRSEKQLRNHER